VSRRQRVGLMLGPLLFGLLALIPAPDGMPPAALKVAAVTALMATFWITEAIPIAATALIPIALFPLLGVLPTSEVTAAYANHLIYLFMGGFLIAVAIQKWQLHRRMALHTLRVVGGTPRRIVLGFMLATAFLSAWISNTAAAMMMVTIAMALLREIASGEAPQRADDRTAGTPLGMALMLGVAYSASIGGVATLIGTPPNAILAGILEERYGVTVGFAQWMAFGVPLSAAMLLAAWFYLTRVVLRNAAEPPALGGDVLRGQLDALGPMSRQERRVLGVFTLVVAAWLLRGFVDVKALAFVTDSSIAMTGALLLFLIPADLKRGEFLLDWATAVRIPWDVIVLFGGGFALASAFSGSGLTAWLGAELTVLQGAGPVVILVAVVLLVIFLTEVTSNTATASLLLPVAGALAVAMEVPPVELMVPVAVAASFAFMLPVATPPNAIVFGSRQVDIPQMARAGIWMNLLGTAFITLFVLLVLPWVWGTG
jgi:sodium-dependent dicarboxylate transporter 2/3/5